MLVRYCVSNHMDFGYLTQFHDSPYGVVVSRELMVAGNLAGDLFEEGRRQQVVKDLPLPVLFALAFEPLMKVRRDFLNGLLERDEILVQRLREACWDALKLRGAARGSPTGNERSLRTCATRHARQRVVLTTELPGRVAPSLVAEIRPRVNGLSQQRLFEEVAQRSLLASKQGLVAVRLAEQVDAVTLYQAIGGGAR